MVSLTPITPSPPDYGPRACLAAKQPPGQEAFVQPPTGLPPPLPGEAIGDPQNGPAPGFGKITSRGESFEPSALKRIAWIPCLVEPPLNAHVLRLFHRGCSPAVPHSPKRIESMPDGFYHVGPCLREKRLSLNLHGP